MASNEFLSVQRDIEDAEVRRQAHPKGWEPRLTVEGEQADLVSRPVADGEPAPGWEDELASRGGDPSRWKPSGPVRFSSWDAQIKGGGVTQMHAYRWNLVPVEPEIADEDLDALIRKICKRKTGGVADRQRETSERALVVVLADWQAGKADHGGVEALMERLESLRVGVTNRVRELRKLGRPVDQLVIAGLGDLVEQCDGHYPMQTFSVELDRRQQERFVRRMLVEMISDWAKLAPRVVVACVPGNHGENRRGGKAFTSFEDNSDLAVFEQAQEVFARNPEEFGHVAWVIPDGDMTVTLDVCGTVIGFAHGHQARKGSTPQQRLRNWWLEKGASRHPIGDADILVSGHYHHLITVEDGPRTWMQAPANDGGSRWFEERGGSTTICGTLTFVADSEGWSDLAIVR